MRSDIVITLTGPDRVGIVEEVTGLLLGLNCNIESSRMARLGGEFAVLMLVSVPDGVSADLADTFRTLTDQGYKVTYSLTAQAPESARAGWQSYRIEVEGADHEGIIHEIAQGLSKQGVNIESMETSARPAPTSGTMLFTMIAEVAVPPGLADTDWIELLGEAGAQANVDIEVVTL